MCDVGKKSLEETYIAWRLPGGIDNGGEGGGDYDALYGRRVGFYGFENACCAVYGGVEEVLLDVCGVKVEGRGGVDDGFEGRV